MSRYEIMSCKLHHLRTLAATLRREDRAEFEMAGMVPRHRLYELWRMTVDPKAALVDGEVAAAWGDAAPLLATEGRMWMVTAPPIERVPLAFFREGRLDIEERLRVRHALSSCIAGPYDKAVRFFAMLGFEIGPPVLIGGNQYRDIRLERAAIPPD